MTFTNQFCMYIYIMCIFLVLRERKLFRIIETSLWFRKMSRKKVESLSQAESYTSHPRSQTSAPPQVVGPPSTEFSGQVHRSLWSFPHPDCPAIPEHSLQMYAAKPAAASQNRPTSQSLQRIGHAYKICTHNLS